MDTSTQVQIFLADQRGLSQTESFRSFHTFNFGTYRADGREPFGDLVLLNDDSLRAGASLNLNVETDTEVWLLPVNGGLEYRIDGDSAVSTVAVSTVADSTVADSTVAESTAAVSTVANFLEPGQAGRFTLPAGTHYTIGNPYEQETIDFLQIWFTQPANPSGISFDVLDVDLSRPNTLLSIGSMLTTQHRLFIGQYDGRAEDIFTLDPDEQGVFVFVIQGVFEVANRLLHVKDGLSLRAVQDNQIEFEALSNGAVLLLMTV